LSSVGPDSDTADELSPNWRRQVGALRSIGSVRGPYRTIAGISSRRHGRAEHGQIPALGRSSRPPTATALEGAVEIFSTRRSKDFGGRGPSTYDLSEHDSSRRHGASTAAGDRRWWRPHLGSRIRACKRPSLRCWGGLVEETWPPRGGESDQWLNRTMAGRAIPASTCQNGRIGPSAHDFAQALATPNVHDARGQAQGRPTVSSRFVKARGRRRTEALGLPPHPRRGLSEMGARRLDVRKGEVGAEACAQNRREM